MIKRRLKYTASFFCVDFCISFWDCLRSCLLSVLLAVVQLSVGFRCVGSDQKKMIVMSAIGVTMWDRLLI